jgi:hypothetical protein
MASSSQIPFAPLGDTVTFTAATTPPTAVQALVKVTETSVGQFRIINAGIVTVFLGVGSTAAEAQANADSSAPAKSIPLVPGAVEILRFPPASFFSGDTASSTAVIYITPGQGL